MAFRRRKNRSKSARRSGKKYFSRNAGASRRNTTRRPMRGGWRL